MPNLKKRIQTFVLLSTFVAFQAFAEAPTVELSSEASRPAINDQAQATLSAEGAGPSLRELSKQVNTLIADALKTAKSYPIVRTQSGSTSTYPMYSKSGKIESWRMRSELSLESSDTAALSDLVGKLQATLGISRLVMQPAPETRKKAENEAMLDALAAFNTRAKVISEALGKPYHIKRLSVNTSGQISPPMFRAAAKSMMTEAAPMPMEAGESQITATISGQIELE